MSERFIKYIPCEKAKWLRKKHPWAYLLLSLIVERARRIDGHIDGLKPGECHIGDYEECGIPTRKTYRHALDVLIVNKFVEKVETCRTRQKGATGTATIGTKVKLLDSSIWDINLNDDGDRKGHRGATEGPPKGHEQERNKKEQECKEQPQTPSISEIETDVSLDVVVLSSKRNFVDGKDNGNKDERLIIYVKETLTKMNLTQDEINSLFTKFKPEEINHAITHATRPGFKPTNLVGYLHWAAKELPSMPSISPSKTTQQQIKEVSEDVIWERGNHFESIRRKFWSTKTNPKNLRTDVVAGVIRIENDRLPLNHQNFDLEYQKLLKKYNLIEEKVPNYAEILNGSVYG